MATEVGFAEESLAASQSSPFDTKIGGSPDFYPRGPPRQLPSCPACAAVLGLYAQLYCPLHGSPYHRTLYCFCCLQPHCTAKQRSWCVLRCQGLEEPIADQIPPPRGPALSEPGGEVGISTTMTTAVGGDHSSLPSLLVASGREESSEGGGGARKTTPPPCDQDRPSVQWCEAEDDWGSEMDDCERTTLDAAIRLSDCPTTSTATGSNCITNGTDCVTSDTDCTAPPKHTANATPSVVQPGPDRSTGDCETLLSDCTTSLSSCTTPSKEEDLSGPMDTMSLAEKDARSPSIDALCRLPCFLVYFVWARDVEKKEGGRGFLSSSARSAMKEFQQQGGEHEEGGDSSGYERAAVEHGDIAFYKFNKRISSCPTQVVRYHLGGEPLLFAAHPGGLDGVVPRCESCGAMRVFEFQLMPYLVHFYEQLITPAEFSSKLKLPEFGTVLVFTCSRSCWKSSEAVRKEFALVQQEKDSHFVSRFISAKRT